VPERWTLLVRVLVVDDESAVRLALQRALSVHDHNVEAVPDGIVALRELEAGDYDVVLLDLQMPAMNGLEVCRTLRGRGDQTPIIVVTARDHVADRVAGLDAGADDYLVKPFALDELLARMRAVSRRKSAAGAGLAPVLRFGDLSLDTATLRATRGSRVIQLSRTEFSLLALFMRHPGEVLPRGRIFEEVWGYDFGDSSNSHEVYVGYLRRKTEAGGESRLIHTVRGSGYVLRNPQEK
jgi:two-component system response regulator MprA